MVLVDWLTSARDYFSTNPRNFIRDRFVDGLKQFDRWTRAKSHLNSKL
jgi:hypothetical protein